MSGEGDTRGPAALRWLLGPSERISDEESRSGARLLAALALAHLLATVVGAIAGTAVRWGMLDSILLWGALGWVLLLGAVLVLVTYVLVRVGLYRPAVFTYLVTTASFPLLAPFVGKTAHETGLLATALIPLVLTATLLAPRWLMIVAVFMVTAAGVELTLVSWPRNEVVLGFTILLVVFGSGVLMAVMRWHQGRLEVLRAERLRRSEAALRASQDRLNTLLSASRDLVVVLDGQGARKAAFGGVAEFTGYDLNQRGAFAHFETMHPEDRGRIKQEFAEMLKHPAIVVRTEWRYLHHDGRYRWHEGLVTNRLGQEGIDGVVVNIRDITDRKLAEEAVTRSERRYRTLFETVTDGIFLFTRDGQLIEVNDAGCRMLGYTREELLTKRIEDIAPEDEREHTQEVRRIVAEKGNLVFVASHRRKDGSIYPVEVAASLTELDGAPLFMGVVRDITDRVRAEDDKRRLQEQLQHAVKMESIGRLAGGVAHDFNNLLTAILGNADLAIFQLREGNHVQDSLDAIRGAALSAATVTRQLLAFSRKHPVDARPVDVNHLVRNMTRILERLIGEDVRLHTVMGQGLGMVQADPGLIEQAIVNLAVNARDAMPSGGDLDLETREVTLDENEARARGLHGAGRYVLILVSDTGMGMSEEVKLHLFEPFFTTKARGKGTGLGLATTYAAVVQSGGSIEAQSEMGRGTRFKIHLPAVPPSVEEEARAQVVEEEGTPCGKETILVAEDDLRVRDMITQSLRGCGYEVMIAGSGEEALALAVACKANIHLLLTDVVMPGINGRELSSLLRKIHPEARTLFTSGYGENIIAHQGTLEPGIEFLSKPYTMDVMARKVRQILDRRE